jgi:hypothetical protein
LVPEHPQTVFVVRLMEDMEHRAPSHPPQVDMAAMEQGRKDPEAHKFRAAQSSLRLAKRHVCPEAHRELAPVPICREEPAVFVLPRTNARLDLPGLPENLDQTDCPEFLASLVFPAKMPKTSRMLHLKAAS